MSTHVRNIDALSTQTRQYALRVLGSVGEPINPEAWEWYRTHVGGGICPVVDTWCNYAAAGTPLLILTGKVLRQLLSAKPPRRGADSSAGATSDCVLSPTPREETTVADSLYHPTTPEIAKRRKELAPHTHDAFEAFSQAVFADGALPEKAKQLIAVAVAHTTQCPYCIRGHTRLAHRAGATDEEIMEAIWVAAEMRAGGAYAHSTLALEALSK